MTLAWSLFLTTTWILFVACGVDALVTPTIAVWHCSADGHVFISMLEQNLRLQPNPASVVEVDMLSMQPEDVQPTDLILLACPHRMPILWQFRLAALSTDSHSPCVIEAMGSPLDVDMHAIHRCWFVLRAPLPDVISTVFKSLSPIHPVIVIADVDQVALVLTIRQSLLGTKAIANDQPFTVLTPTQPDISLGSAQLGPSSILLLATPSRNRTQQLETIAISLHHRVAIVDMVLPTGGPSDQRMTCPFQPKTIFVSQLPLTSANEAEKDISWTGFLTAVSAPERVVASSQVGRSMWDAALIIRQALEHLTGEQAMSQLPEILRDTDFQTLFSGSVQLGNTSKSLVVWSSLSSQCANGTLLPSNETAIPLDQISHTRLTRLLPLLQSQIIIRVAVPLPLTVPGYDNGRSAEWQAALDVAFEGLSKRDASHVTFEATYFDTNRNCSQLGEYFVQKEFHAVIGAVRSSCSGPMAEVLGQAGIPQISFASTASSLSDKAQYPTFFRIPPSDVHQGRLLASLCKAYNFTSVAIIMQDDAYGRGLGSAFETAFAGHNYQITYRGVIATSQPSPKSLRETLLAARATGTSVFLTFALLAPTHLLLDQAAQLNMVGRGWVYLTVDANTFASDMGTPFVDGVVGVRPRSGSGQIYRLWLSYASPSGVGDALRRRLSLRTASGGYLPNTYVPHCFDAAEALYLAALRIANQTLGSSTLPTVDHIRTDLVSNLKLLNSPASGFPGSTNRAVYFDQAGDGPVVYSLANIASNGLKEVGYAEADAAGHLRLMFSEPIVWGAGQSETPSTTSNVRRTIAVACLCLHEDAAVARELEAACPWSAKQVSGLEGVDINVHIVKQEQFMSEDFVLTVDVEVHIELCTRTQEYLLTMHEELELVAIVGAVPSLCAETWAIDLVRLGLPQLVFSTFPRLPVGLLPSSTPSAAMANASAPQPTQAVGTLGPLYLLDGGIELHVRQLLQFLRHHGWHRFAVLSHEALANYTHVVGKMAAAHNITLLGWTNVADSSTHDALNEAVLQHVRHDASVNVIFAPDFYHASLYLQAAESSGFTGASWAWVLALGSWQGVHFARSVNFEDAVVLLSPPVGEGSRYVDFLPSSSDAAGVLFRFSFPSPGLAGNIGPSVLSLRLHDCMSLVGQALQAAIADKVVGYHQDYQGLRDVLLEFLPGLLGRSQEEYILTSGRAGTILAAHSLLTGRKASSLTTPAPVSLGTQILNVAAGVFSKVGWIDSGNVALSKTVIWGDDALRPPTDVPEIHDTVNVGYVILSLRQQTVTSEESILYEQLHSAAQLFAELQDSDVSGPYFTLSSRPSRATMESCEALPASLVSPADDIVVAVGPESCIYAIAEIAATNGQAVLAVVTEHDEESKTSGAATTTNIFWLTPQPHVDGEVLAALVARFGWEAVNVLAVYNTSVTQEVSRTTTRLLRSSGITALQAQLTAAPQTLALSESSDAIFGADASRIHLLALTSNASSDLEAFLAKQQPREPVYLASRDLLDSSSPLVTLLSQQNLLPESTRAFIQGMLALDLPAADRRSAILAVVRNAINKLNSVRPVFSFRLFQTNAELLACHPLASYVVDAFIAISTAANQAAASRHISYAVPRSQYKAHIVQQLRDWNNETSPFTAIHGSRLYFDRDQRLQPQEIVVRNGDSQGMYQEVARWSSDTGLEETSNIFWPDGTANAPTAFSAPASSANKRMGPHAAWIALGIILVMVLVLVALLLRSRSRSRQPLDFFQTVRDHHGKAIPTELDRGNITLGEMVGHGAFGDVHRGRLAHENITLPVAIKTLKMSSGHSKELQEFMREASLLCQLKHPNIVGFLGVSTTVSPFLLVTAYAEFGSLRQLLRERQGLVRLPLWGKLMMARDVARGMEAIHGHGLVHRDLAARNVLVDEDYTCKVGDFGHARSKDASGQCYIDDDRVAVAWTAPEALSSYTFSERTDVWSYGVMVWELFSDGAQPYQELEHGTVTRLLAKGHRLGKPSGCPRDVYILMLACWAQVPNDRLTFSEICSTLDTALKAFDAQSTEDEVLHVQQRHLSAWRVETTRKGGHSRKHTPTAAHLHMIRTKYGDLCENDGEISQHLQIPAELPSSHASVPPSPTEIVNDDHSYVELREPDEQKNCTSPTAARKTFAVESHAPASKAEAENDVAKLEAEQFEIVVHEENTPSKMHEAELEDDLSCSASPQRQSMEAEQPEWMRSTVFEEHQESPRYKELTRHISLDVSTRDDAPGIARSATAPTRRHREKGNASKPSTPDNMPATLSQQPPILALLMHCEANASEKPTSAVSKLMAAQRRTTTSPVLSRGDIMAELELEAWTHPHEAEAMTAEHGGGGKMHLGDDQGFEMPIMRKSPTSDLLVAPKARKPGRLHAFLAKEESIQEIYI
eukprot:m.213618 g.213618  ORF g.213618 m.213618 type:complete len:2386 (-) comp16957_c0_seq1:273-7430(-)